MPFPTGLPFPDFAALNPGYGPTFPDNQIHEFVFEFRSGTRRDRQII